MAHGNSVKSEASFFLIGKSTLYSIVPEVCQAIFNALAPIYLRLPNKEEFKVIAEQFEARYNFPHTIGACDGKHVRLKCPRNSNSLFRNFKSFFSVVLMAVSDSFGRFIYADFGKCG